MIVKNRMLAAAAVVFCMAMLWSVVEGCSYLAYWMIFRESYSKSGILAQQDTVVGNSVDKLTTAGKSDCVIHPYYGYAHNDNFNNAIPPHYETDSSAEFGFYDTRSLTPFDRQTKYFVAVTGGSVAHLFALQALDALLPFVDKLPQAQGKKIEFFDLSNWGYKQPQQLLVLSDLMHRGVRFDLLLNIDGLNELTLSVSNLREGVSPFFPTQWDSASETMLSKKAMEAYGQAAMLQRWREQWATRCLAWPHDPFLGLAWRLLDVTLAKKIVAIRAVTLSKPPAAPGDAIRLSENGKIMLGPNRVVDPASFAGQAVASWARASALMADLVRACGGRYVHVLQPNQYVEGGKALSPQEKNTAYLSDSPNKPLVETGYPLLRLAGEALGESGVPFLDLSLVFADVSDTLYVDTCCHFNREGNVLLAQAIGRALPELVRPGEKVSFAHLDQKLHEDGLYDKQRFAQEASLDVDFLKEPLTASVKVRGLADREGAADAMWRWGLGPKTEISFSLPGDIPVTLRYALASPFSGQEMTVFFNGREVDRQTNMAGTEQLLAPPASLVRELRLPGRAGDNVLELRYRFANGYGKTMQPAETRPFAVIFRELRLAAKPQAQEGLTTVPVVPTP